MQQFQHFCTAFITLRSTKNAAKRSLKMSCTWTMCRFLWSQVCFPCCKLIFNDCSRLFNVL